MSADVMQKQKIQMQMLKKETIISIDENTHVPNKEHVLVVDDENGPRQAMRMLLKEAYEVHIAENSIEALNILEKFPIGLVVSDIRMPKVTGVELLAMIKSQNVDVQVIMVTGYGELDTAMKSVELGAFAYLEKPYDIQKMLGTVSAGHAKYTQERDRRSIENLALEASRFTTLGRLVSGTMHDLGTPLTVLNSHLELLSVNPDRDDIQRRITTMRSQVKYCTELTKNTMDFLRHEKGIDRPLQINDVVESCMSIGSPYFRETGTSFDTKLSSELPKVIGESVLLRQSLMNILNNACQAMENRSKEEGRKAFIRTFRDGESVCITIEDSGSGIPIELREKIFEMFYSTKGTLGTGLGLGVVKSVMTRCGGSIKLIKGMHGSGACFRLEFPIAS